jgi:CRP/FNR family transcriptional regulator, dissimilatory nitrate respiration regulator
VEIEMKTLQPKPGVVANHLAGLPVFSVLGLDDRELLASQALLKLYDRGESLFERGQPADRLFCVVHGAIRVVRRGPGGREKVIHLLEGPALVAEVPVLTGIDYPASADCAEPCTVLVLPRTALLEGFRRDQDLAMKLLGAAMARMHELTASLAAHGQRSGAMRVASYLLGLAHTQGERLSLPAAKKDVACFLGLQPESFSRALGSLKKEGIIEVDEQQVGILDRAALERMLAES